MLPTTRTALPFLALAALAGAARGQTITVTISSDVVDVDWQTATVADLPGPDGEISFSEAMIASNNTPGRQTIGFAIPPSDWTLQFLFPGRAVLRTTTGFFFRAFDEVTIDGTTQTAFSGDTNPDGNELVIYAATLYLNADFCTLTGVDSSSVSVTASGGLIEGNTGTMSIEVFGGSGSLLRNNSASTIKIDRSSGNVVIGNTMQRVRVLGGGSSQLVTNNRVGGPTLAERNFITGYGTWNSEGFPAGAAIQLAWTQGTRIENNWIGTTPDGLAQGNLACTMGIDFETENHDVVVLDNRIAGIKGLGMGPHAAGLLFGWALYFWGSTTNILIEGNTIGLNALDEPVLGSVWGVNVDNFAGYSVDGVSIVDNVIAGHLLDGVRVGPTADMRLSRNRIFGNGWLGIDLIPTSFASGVSANDPLDLDVGGSGVQNYPVIAQALSAGGALQVRGTLDSSPSDDFTVEVFASSACDPSGFGEAELFLGSTAVVTDAAGHADFELLLPGGLPPGWVVVATATLEPLGATSELSACAPITDGASGASFCAGDGTETTACPCGNFGLSGRGCDNAQGTGGVQLAATGDPALNDVVLLGAGFPPAGAPSVVAIRGPGRETPPALFGDGLRCLATAGLVRVGATTASAGTSALALNHAAGAGTFHYQLWYRNTPASFCDAAAAFNLSNGLSLVWP